MWAIFVFVAVGLLKITIVCGNINEKCCKPGHSFIEKNSTLTCDTSKTLRIGSFFKKSDYLVKNISGTCIEVYNKDNIAIFSVEGVTGKMSTKEKVKMDFFPKCCPVGQKYNTTIHSCEINGSTDNLTNFISDSTFLKIGLPQCKIIYDSVFPSPEEVRRKNKEKFTNKGTVIPNGRFCLDSTLNGDFVVRNCEVNDQICGKIRCIHKCCPDGQSYVGGAKCSDTFKFGLDLHSTRRIQDSDSRFVIIHGIQKPIYRMSEAQYNFSIDTRGILTIYMNETHEKFAVSDNQYCMEHAIAGQLNGYFIFARQTEREIPMKISVTKWIKIVSCIFLLLTILVYLIVPKMRNLFGKILLSYSVASFFMFFFLGFSQFYHESFNNSTCRLMGFLSVLSMIWSFTWLHIMTIEIWFSFRAPRTMSGPLQKSEMKRLLQYSVCGWGIPIFWILFIFLLSRMKEVSETIRPIVGDQKCYLENTDTHPGNYAYILFVIIPLLIQQIINSVLFVRTITHCLRIKAEIEKMRDGNAQKDLKASKKRLILVLKLAVIMGVSFLFETISSIIDFSSTNVTTYIETIWDSVNCLQGVFIFVIFICKKKVYDNICEEIPFLKSRKSPSMSSSATQQISLQQCEGN